jgi:hypothetical protein
MALQNKNGLSPLKMLRALKKLSAAICSARARLQSRKASWATTTRFKIAEQPSTKIAHSSTS